MELPWNNDVRTLHMLTICNWSEDYAQNIKLVPAQPQAIILIPYWNFSALIAIIALNECTKYSKYHVCAILRWALEYKLPFWLFPVRGPRSGVIGVIDLVQVELPGATGIRTHTSIMVGDSTTTKSYEGTFLSKFWVSFSLLFLHLLQDFHIWKNTRSYFELDCYRTRKVWKTSGDNFITHVGFNTECFSSFLWPVSSSSCLSWSFRLLF